MKAAGPLDRLDPELALRPGSMDAHLVLFLWCLRKTFIPLLLLGLSVAIVAYGDVDSLQGELNGFDDPKVLVSKLLSPLGVLVLAVGLRIVVNFAALGAAFPLAMRSRSHHYDTGNRVARRFHLWRDRLYLARAYRALRLTWAVRDKAHQRLGDGDRVYRICELSLIWANWVLVVGLFVVMWTVASNQA